MPSPFLPRQIVGRLRRAHAGTTAIEYAMIALFIAIVLIALLATIGTSVTSMFQSVANGF